MRALKVAGSVLALSLTVSLTPALATTETAPMAPTRVNALSAASVLTAPSMTQVAVETTEAEEAAKAAKRAERKKAKRLARKKAKLAALREARQEARAERQLVRMGPSKWKGKRLRHPRGYSYYSNVIRWANLVRVVMDEHDLPRRYIRGVLAQIQQESGGNPYAVNRWDSNAARGTPSMGLLQIIAPTYRYYAKPGYSSTRYQTVPYTNLWASLNYVKKRYGMWKFASWNRGYNHGY